MELDQFIKKDLANKIVETELPRYTNFFTNSYRENLKHSEAVLNTFPRWSIISGYYAMQDITKLFLAKKFQIKIDAKVHKTVIQIMETITKDKATLNLLKIGYEEFTKMAADLVEAKGERQKAQYYTGSEFMKEKYKETANEFLNNIVLPYLERINALLK